MELILVFQFMVVAFGSFVYVESIDLYDRLHTQYKQQMGVN